MYERILLDQFNVLGKNFVIFRVPGQNINGKYYLNACVVSLFSFWFVWLGGNEVFILIVCALHTLLYTFSYIMLYKFYGLSSVDACQESCLGTVINWALFNANWVLPKNFVFINTKRLWNVWSPKCILILMALFFS